MTLLTLALFAELWARANFSKLRDALGLWLRISRLNQVNWNHTLENRTSHSCPYQHTAVWQLVRINSPDDWTTSSFFCLWVYFFSHDVGNRVCKIIYFLIPNQIIDVKRGVCGKQTAQTTTWDIHAARHLPHSKHTSLCTRSERLNVAAVNRVSKFIFILVCFHTAN